jgi:hypothetical protein
MYIIESACIYMCHKWQRESFLIKEKKQTKDAALFEYNDDMVRMLEEKKDDMNRIYIVIINTCDRVLYIGLVYIDVFIFDGQ